MTSSSVQSGEDGRQGIVFIITGVLAFLLRKWHLPSPNDLLVFVGLGLFTACGIYCLSQAYRLGRPSMIAPLEYIAVPLSVLLGYVFWGDMLEWHAFIGAAMIVGGGVYLFTSKKA